MGLGSFLRPLRGNRTSSDGLAARQSLRARSFRRNRTLLANRRAGRGSLVGHPAGLLGVRLLVVMSVAADNARLAAITGSLAALCAEHTWVRAMVNFFRGRPTGLPSCASAHAIPGFKTLFWKQSLTPQAVASFSHVFLVDSDLELSPERFELGTFLQLAKATNVSILGPAPFGMGNGLYRLNNDCGDDSPIYARCRGSPKCTHQCQQGDPAQVCAVCRQPVVEVKAPLFTSLAWATVHRLVLAGAPDEVLTTDADLDLDWCDLINHHVHGCDTRKGTTCWPKIGAACAISYATPIYHHNDVAIKGNWSRSYDKKAPFRKYLAEAGIQTYAKTPTARPHGTLLSTQMCWSVSELRATSAQLASWEGFDASKILPVAAPGAPACCRLPKAERVPFDGPFRARGCTAAPSQKNRLNRSAGRSMPRLAHRAQSQHTRRGHALSHVKNVGAAHIDRRFDSGD